MSDMKPPKGLQPTAREPLVQHFLESPNNQEGRAPLVLSSTSNLLSSSCYCLILLVQVLLTLVPHTPSASSGEVA